ncbi:MAG: AMP-binding protein [Phaeodactylibacter sp.]|nr:AMP-binding protein [Phaeodactylibacter sp.]
MSAYNLATALHEMAASKPDALAIALPKAKGKPLPAEGPIPYREITFKELSEQTHALARGLIASGFQQGDRVVLMVPPSLEFFTLSFAFMQAGIVPVLIDPGIGFKHLKACIGEAEPVGFIGISKAHAARVLLGWGSATIKKKVTIGPRLFWGGAPFRRLQKAGRQEAPAIDFEIKTDDISAILFTSGSTGVPKGVMYTYGNMWHQVQVIRQTFKLQFGEVDLPTFPPFALFNPTSGIASIIPDMDPTRPAEVDPERIIRVIEQYGITNMFGSPALLDRVGRYGEAHQIKLPTLKRVISAGAPVPAKTLRRFSGMLQPETPIFTPYGATETMPLACISSHELLTETVQQRTDSGGGICIGKPVDSLTLRIIGISDLPIESWSDDLEVGVGEIGEIVVKGKHVTRAYFNRSEATQLAKIPDGDSFWHRMGDLGYIDTAGNIWFCGRKAHRVQLPDKELYSVQCEFIFNKHPKVHRTALVGVGQEPVLCVEIDQEAEAPDLEQIRKELLAWAAGNDLTKDILQVLFHPSFPVDIRHNAKIFREKLAPWAAQKIKGV